MDPTPSSNPSTPSFSSAALALLASRASVALDLAATSQAARWTDVRELGDVLRSLVPTPALDEPGSRRQALVQTEAVDVVDRALAFSGDHHPTTLEELRAEVERLSAALHQASATTPPDELGRLRDLCVALARAAQAQEPAPVYHRPGAGTQR